MLKAANRNKKLENVAVMLTNRCNLSCKHCCASQIMSEKDISFDIVRKVVELNPHQICITGGEPLLYKNIEEVLKFIKKHYNGKLLLATNGLLVNKYIDMIVKYFDKVTSDGIYCKHILIMNNGKMKLKYLPDIGSVSDTTLIQRLRLAGIIDGLSCLPSYLKYSYTGSRSYKTLFILMDSTDPINSVNETLAEYKNGRGCKRCKIFYEYHKCTNL